MRFCRGDILRGAVLGLVCTAAAAIIAIPLLVWDSERAPEFFGAFTAAIVAAVAVILGAFYQHDLTRQRDEERRRRKQYVQAIDLCFWLDHAASELEFIADTLVEMSHHLKETGAFSLDWTQQHYREVVSAEFMNELPARAKSAAQLPWSVAEPVAKSLYQTFMHVERLHWRRGISDAQTITAAHIAAHAQIVRAEAARLRSAQQLLSEHTRATPT